MKVLAEGLARQHKLALCVTGSVDDEGSSESAFYRSLDIPVHFLSSGEKLKHRIGAAKIQTALRLRKRIAAFQPDIVHTFGQSATHIAAAVLLRDSKTKLCSSVFSKWKPHTTPTKRFERCLLNRVDRFVLADECLRSELQNFDIANEKLSVITNAVRVGNDGDPKLDKNQQQRGRELLMRETGLDATAFVAMTSADLLPVTRLKDLIWATDLLSCVRDDVHLVIFGKGSQHQNLLKFAACTEAADHIHFVGLPAQPLEMFGGADVYWNSHLQTPTPSSVLAAMNFGVPVISVYGPETSPLVLHQETGFAVNVGARDEFARWTKFLIEKPESAQQLGDQGRRHCRHQFRANPMVRMVERIYAT